MTYRHPSQEEQYQISALLKAGLTQVYAIVLSIDEKSQIQALELSPAYR